MSLKFGSWLVGIGCLMAMAGLGFLPAAFGPHQDASMMSAGAMLFSAGMVVAASGLYVKSRVWSLSAPAGAKPEKKSTRKPCKLCGKQEPVIQCRPHQIQLCADCLSRHFDFRSCSYVPLERPATSKAPAAKPKARAQTTSA